MARLLRNCQKKHRPTITFLFGGRFEYELSCHRDRRLEASVNRTFIRKHAVSAHRGFPMKLLGFEPHPHVNASDDEYVLFQLNFTHRFSDQASAGCVDLTRLQRASEGSRKSTCRGRDDVIERGRLRFRNRRRHLIMLRDGAVYPENHRVCFSRQIGPTNRAFDTFNSDLGTVDHFGHELSSSVGFALELRGSALAVETFVIEAPFERNLLRNVALTIVACLIAERSFNDESA